MKASPHSEPPDREFYVIRLMLDDLTRVIRLLESDIAAEEDRTGCSDAAAPIYSTLAKNLAARMENLTATVGSLNRRLAPMNSENTSVAA